MLQWMWECICLLEAVFLCSPNQYWVEPLPGHVVVVFIFSGTSIPFVTVAAPFSIPSNSAVSPRLHTLDHTWCLSLGQLPFQPLSGDSRLWVWLMFPWPWLVMSNHFFCLLAPVRHLWKVSIHIFSPFFIQFLFVLICMRVVCLLDISLFSHIWFADIFFLWGQWPFKFRWFLLPCGRFQLDVVPLVDFCFCCLCIWCPIWRLFAKTNVERLSTCVFLEVYGFGS